MRSKANRSLNFLHCNLSKSSSYSDVNKKCLPNYCKTNAKICSLFLGPLSRIFNIYDIEKIQCCTATQYIIIIRKRLPPLARPKIFCELTRRVIQRDETGAGYEVLVKLQGSVMTVSVYLKPFLPWVSHTQSDHLMN